jgi:NAD(P)-dependent dehydrogenase (short-subunit alcohol dehydrogenase family)
MYFIPEGPVSQWRSVLDLNVLGLSICTKEALQSMRERGVDDGHIIHISRY